MNVSYVLMKMARVQNDLYRLSRQMLKEDKSDGVRWINWMDRHDTLLRDTVDDARGHLDITEEEENAIIQASKPAGQR